MQEMSYDSFTINKDYFNAVPRPTKDEYNALELKIIQRGQQEPISVNKDMVILDGHTRYEIMSQRGMDIKYTVREFESKEDEFYYVVESNLMRRQLNNFQKLEALYGMYMNKKRQIKTLKKYSGWIDILESIKNGNNTRNTIAKDIGYMDSSVGKILLKMIESYYVRREKKFKKYGNGLSGGTTFSEYTLLPKSEEFLSNNKKINKGGASIMVSKITGLNRNTVSKGMALIDICDEKTKQKLRNGTLSIYGVYADITKSKKPKSLKYSKSWSRHSKIKCPHCQHISEKHEFEVIRKR